VFLSRVPEEVAVTVEKLQPAGIGTPFPVVCHWSLPSLNVPTHHSPLPRAKNEIPVCPEWFKSPIQIGGLSHFSLTYPS